MSSPPIPSPAQDPYSSPPVTIVLTIILLVFFFVGSFSVYFCRCCFENLMTAWGHRLTESGTDAGPNAAAQNVAIPGLDPVIIQSFPKFKYEAVKDLRKGKIGLECAICLSDFSDDDYLRLLIFCCHVFHQDCIDLWLERHKTCPVCRTALDSVPDEKTKSADNSNNPFGESHILHNGSEASVRISILEGDEEHEILNVHHNGFVTINIDEDEDSIRNMRKNAEEALHKRRATAERISRCHSTGHSIFRNKVEDVDKYTLTLPEHLKELLAKGHHQGAKSFDNLDELSVNTAKDGNGFGEVSGSSSAEAGDKV